MTNHETYMQLALEQADKAASLGEVPVGAVLIWEGKILAMNHNRREIFQDPLAHAEIFVIQEAAHLLNSWRLTGASLYVTLEPCLMCAGAILQSRISNLIFGAMDPKAGACGSLINVLELPGLTHRVNTTAGVLEEPCRRMLHMFFKHLREKPGLSMHSTCS